MRRRRRKGIMFQVVFAVLLSIFASGVQAESKPHYYSTEVHFKATVGDYTRREFVYQITVSPAMAPGHGDLAKKFLAWSKERLEQELPHTKISGCSQELKEKFWKILSDELKYWRGLSVKTVCRQAGLSANAAF